ncbi:PH domain-containing protein [Janibacter hoylei]|uniref:PH domain-containing protein n=1 Tax=Janibacter hoylei TaxID=364298 RepID=UPI0021A8D4C9|nr:PH domain-containing protein [Janibacter hoylei]MCT2293573.1 PH domain-containing protein [Janibacter hoylei]
MSQTPTTDFVRVHPVSPFIRGGLIVLGFLGYVVSQQVDRVAGSLGPDAEGGAFGVGLVQLGVLALVVLGAIGIGLLSWWFTRYRIGADSIEMRTGAIFRQHRQVRYDRIQAVDVVRPLLARLFGLSEVRVESAGGGDSHLSIAYLRMAEADAVRQRLLGLAHESGSEVPADEGSTPHPERTVAAAAPTDGPPLLVVPPARIVASVLLGGEAIFVALLLLVALVLSVLGLGAVIGGLAPAAVIGAGRALMRLTRWWGLTIGLRGPRTLTSQRGLTDTRISSVPLHRVQAVAIEQPWLWRRPGWWSLKVNVAGAEIGSASESTDTVLVPVATTTEVLRLLEAVTGDPQTTAEAGSLVAGTPEGFVGLPGRSRWVHPFARRRIGYLAGQRSLLTRSGWLDHTLQIVPWGRIQSLTVTQGPISQRLDLASVAVVSTVGPVSPRVQHLDRAGAERLRALAEQHASPARRGRSGGPACVTGPDTVDCDG